jgi:hypothetical protein
MKTTPEIRIDRTKTLVEEPGTGHNPLAPRHSTGDPLRPRRRGDPQTRDAFDGQLGPATSRDDVAAANLDVVHPLTGPVYIDGAEPGDLLDIEILDVEPDSYRYTVQVPGVGFLRDEFPEPFKVNWDIAGGWATCADLQASASPEPRSWARSACLPAKSCSLPSPPANRPCSTAAAWCPPVSRRSRPHRPEHRRPRPCGPSRPASRPVDLKVSQLVDVPNMLVSAFLPEDIFTGG